MTEATTTIKRLYDWDSTWQLVHKAKSFESKIQLKMRGMTIDAKSWHIVNSLPIKAFVSRLLTVALFKGTEVAIVADGSDEAEAVRQLKEMFDSDANKEVEKVVENIRAKRLERLKKYTDDENILANVERVAFEQQELDYLLKVADEIYLCANRFVIPLRVKNKSYIGIGEAVVTFNSRERVNFDKRKIYFKNISFDNETIKSTTNQEVKPIARKDRFALRMEDGAEVRNIDDLKAHFDIGSVVRDFSSGRLLKWLEDRYYDDEAEAIRKISPDENSLEYTLCKIFQVETLEEIERREERLNRLKQYTDDKKILSNVDKVAFDQEDLADLLDEGVDEIYLCANRFVIPLRMKNKVYIGVKDAVAVIRRKEPVNFDELGIKFQNVDFDDDYQKIVDALKAMTNILTKITSQPETKLKNTQTTTKSKPFRFIDQKPTSPPVSYPKAEATTIITYKPGFHASPSAVFVQTASKFKSKIQVKAKGKTIDAKSILMIMSMGLVCGTEITIMAEGEDAKEAVDTLKSLIDRRFYPELGEMLSKHRR